MTKEAAPLAERSWFERNLSSLMVGIFGTTIAALMVVMVDTVKDLRQDLVALDGSLAALQTEMVSTRVELSGEVALIDDGIIQSIDRVRDDLSIANQHLTGIDTHLALIKREFSAPADFTLSSAELAPDLVPDLDIPGTDDDEQRDR